MPTNDTVNLEGMYHDVLRDPRGRVIWDRGWKKNAIVVNCRRVLAALLANAPTDEWPAVFGIEGLQIGAGSEQWDQFPPTAPDPNRTALVDANPHLILKDDLQIDFLDGSNPTDTPTNRLQIFARLGAGVPPWPGDGNHLTSSLREFGLVGQLAGQRVLLNYVIHPVITKDPFSILERTLWLVF